MTSFHRFTQPAVERASVLKHKESENSAGKCCRLLPFELIWAFVHAIFTLMASRILHFSYGFCLETNRRYYFLFVFFCPKLNALFPHVSAFEAR